MFPIRDSEPSRATPWITRALVAFCAAVFIYELMLPDAELRGLVRRGGIVPADWGSDTPWPELLWPLLTSMFLHGGLLHALSNLWALWIFGDNVEERLGALRFLAFYVLCGSVSGVLHALAQPESTLPTIGASGAVAGVMGAYFVLFPRSRVVTVFPILCFPLFVELPAFVYLGLWFLIQLASGASALGAQGDSGGIAWWAHVGGFLVGIALLRVLAPRRAPLTPDEPAP